MKEVENNEKLPEGAVFSLTIPLSRDQSRKATFHLKEIDEETFMAAKSMIDREKYFDAVRMIIQVLRVGGDDPQVLKNNLIAVNAASSQIMKLIEPLDSELKKN
jgi:hypothetical protein